MTKAFRPYTLDQQLLLPPDMRQWLPEGDLALFISDVVDELDLAVNEHEVVTPREPAHGRLPTNARMGASAIVVLKPAGQHPGAIGGGVIRARVRPFTQQRLNEALGLAVGAGRVGTRAMGRHPQRPTRRAKSVRAITRPVVGEDPPYPDAVSPEPGQRASHEPADGFGPLIRQQFDIGHAGAVIDGDVHE